VIVMAAFRGRSLLFRLGCAGVADVDFVDVGGESTGFDFCASRSGRLMLATSSPLESVDVSCLSDDWGDRELSSWGLGPAMEVSGTPLFRGGGGIDSGML